ncbi:MAG: LamG-like jellyroll fold domain-containing protein [Leifsonia sp.]|uniref:LamG-like jellyroll fold domain-containing protein n=1 Tax=Leifsonia sp. TaxID=1870902 RepID=UPI003F80D32F
MNNPNTRRRTRPAAVASLLAATALAVASLAIGAPAVADTQPPDPTSPATPPTVDASVLPTTQIDGVAWSQAIVGSTVYVGGKFSTARPAGSPAGSNTVGRANLLAYNVTTGALISTFNIPLNAQVRAVAASPDGSRVYVGGDFTTAGGASYYRLMAISTATGTPITSFRPVFDAQVRALAVTNTSVYAGGVFSSVNGTARSRLVQLSASTGSVVTSWNASADAPVSALAISPDGTRLYAGGPFTQLNGASHYGLGMLSAATGASMAFPVESVVRDAGANAGITSLAASSDRVYGAGYVFGSGGNLEGSFSADLNGNLIWIEDCHGDTYSVYPTDTLLYAVGHPHMCSNVNGGFPEVNPRFNWHALAFSKAVTGTLTNDGNTSYANFKGRPSPMLQNWFPDFAIGTYTGQNQAAWSVTGNGQYVTMGGEFPSVNGVAQYGLARFAADSVVRSTAGPKSTADVTPDASSQAAGQVRVDWMSASDPDNVTLTYTLVRDGNTASPVYRATKANTFWTRGPMSFTDTGLAPGSSHSYRLTVTDPDGNAIGRTGNTVTVASSASAGTYGDAVSSSGASAYWRLNEPSGVTAFDHIGTNDLLAQPGVTRNQAGPVSGVPAAAFNGTSNGWASTRTAAAGPQTFTIEAWFRTTTGSGGKIIGFGNSISNGWNSSSYDRHIYMDNSGRLFFGVYPGSQKTINSPGSYKNGAWHQVVASLGSNGMRLYVDGAQVASRTDVTSAQAYNGYWRIGGDTLGSWPSAPSSIFFSGSIGQVSITPSVLSAATVAAHYHAAGY